MPWLDLHEGVLEIFAEHAERAHCNEWEAWARHESRARKAIESETLGLDTAFADLKEQYLSPHSIRGLSVQEVLERKRDYEQASADKESEIRRLRAKKISSSARASRNHYNRTVSDPVLHENRLASKRESRYARRHAGQLEIES